MRNLTLPLSCTMNSRCGARFHFPDSVLLAGAAGGLLPASDESRLPACCRRHGAHHCAMAMRMAAMMAQDASGKTHLHCALQPAPCFPAPQPYSHR